MRYPLLLISAWLLLLATELLAPQPALTTVINFVSLDGPGEGFNDTSAPDPASIAGGNNGLPRGATIPTLGGQRQIAAQFAADIWANFISSKVLIVVDAKFDAPNSEHPNAVDPFNSLNCTKNPPVIATAEPMTYHGNFNKAPKLNTWYPQALANSLVGKDQSSSSDIRAYFNSSVGTPQCLPDKSWYYGLDGNARPDQFDFVTVVLRELAHGLGFITTVNLTNGQKLGGFDDAFSLNLNDVSTGKLFPQMTNGERLIAMSNTGNLRWVGANVVAAHCGDMPMYGPPDIDSDFSVSNWDTSLQSGSVTIPADCSTALITVTPVDDALVEGTETVILTLSANSAYTVGSPNSATVNIADKPPLPTVTIAATSPNASEVGPTNGQFTVTRTGATTSALAVNYAISGTATNGLDYSTLSGSVTIPALSDTATITVTPIDDARVEGTETVILILSTDARYTIGTQADAVVTITDSDSTPLPAVSIAATSPNASEAGPTPGQFAVTRTGSTTSALTINYTIGGTATNTTDYETLSGSVTIEAGFSTALITVTPKVEAPAVTEGTETVILTLSANAAYTVISPSSATVNIADDSTPLPAVSIEANQPDASETGPTPGQFAVTRTGSTTSALTINYTIGGTATNTTDYETLSGSVTIEAGFSTALITVTPIDDDSEEGRETVVLTLNADSAYTLGSQVSATVAIADNDPPPPAATVSIAASVPAASEIGPVAGQFTITRTGSTDSPLIVNYIIGGTATNGVDYTIGPHELLEPFYTTPNHDVGLALDALGDIGWPLDPGGTVKVTSLDDAVIEGTPTGFMVHRTGATDLPVTVHYKISGTAKNGKDYADLGTLYTQVDIPAGESSATITVVPSIDAVPKEKDEAVTITLLADSFYTLGFPIVASVIIQNNVVAFGKGTPPQAEKDVLYNFELPVSGGQEPYVVTISKGALPEGLNLSGLTIQGEPSTAAKTGTFTITITDQQGGSASKTYKITVLTAVNITTTSPLKDGQIGKPYSATLKATGGKKAYTWSETSGTLPATLTLDPATGRIAGTPLVQTTYNLTFKVTDALGGTAEKTLDLTIK